MDCGIFFFRRFLNSGCIIFTYTFPVRWRLFYLFKSVKHKEVFWFPNCFKFLNDLVPSVCFDFLHTRFFQSLISIPNIMCMSYNYSYKTQLLPSILQCPTIELKDLTIVKTKRSVRSSMSCVISGSVQFIVFVIYLYFIGLRHFFYKKFLTPWLFDVML